MHKQPVYRAWAVAEDAPLRPTGAAPAPFGLDFEEGQDDALNSTIRAAFHSSSGWSEETGQALEKRKAAGVRPKDGRSAEACLLKSRWDNPDWKNLKSNYMVVSDKQAVERYHRRLSKTENMSQGAREAQWVKCFEKWQRQKRGVPENDNITLIAATDFSMLPAGWTVDGKQLPNGALPVVKTNGEAFREAKALKEAKQPNASPRSTLESTMYPPAKAFEQQAQPNLQLESMLAGGGEESSFAGFVASGKEPHVHFRSPQSLGSARGPRKKEPSEVSSRAYDQTRGGMTPPLVSARGDSSNPGNDELMAEGLSGGTGLAPTRPWTTNCKDPWLMRHAWKGAARRAQPENSESSYSATPVPSVTPEPVKVAAKQPSAPQRRKGVHGFDLMKKFGVGRGNKKKKETPAAWTYLGN
eukprot:TRINITY_DN110894_c0_g1_i1.p1 TRINITY_DN110894_c0_g1~~TRINITY_DN110894_c0_g1_i1.p1  ORF type:complete len:413 (+),score=91.22 TRINITY_DN110894_c0_g1_i1:79-1317(+)